jgi:hypothetical protein
VICDHCHGRPAALGFRDRGAAPENDDIDHADSLADARGSGDYTISRVEDGPSIAVVDVRVPV